MKLIKLDAIDSTNTFLKGLVNDQKTENFTVVSAENQTNGRGQMGTTWHAEPGKNITMSVLVNDLLVDIDEIYLLNIATTLAIIETLKKYNIPKLCVKWPNDIMSDNQKIGGILIENSIKPSGEISSVIGIGLNVNQTNFDVLKKASSLALITKHEIDKDALLTQIVTQIKKNTLEIKKGNTNVLWEQYHNLLFKKDIPTAFQDQYNRNFMGIIKGVSALGKLEVLLEDDTVKWFGIKEITMLY